MLYKITIFGHWVTHILGSVFSIGGVRVYEMHFKFKMTCFVFWLFLGLFQMSSKLGLIDFLNSLGVSNSISNLVLIVLI
jgi:NhaP-type Na+/H+ and K+/H+ antiporter